MNRIGFKEQGERKQNMDLRSLIEEFVDSGMPEMKVSWKTRYCSPYSCAGSLNTAVERASRKSQVKSTVKKGEVYLVNLNKSEEKNRIFGEESSDRIQFIEVDPDAVRPKMAKGKYDILIKEFMESGIKAANVPWKAHAKSKKTMYNSMYSAIRRANLTDAVKVVQRGENLYLYNKEAE